MKLINKSFSILFISFTGGNVICTITNTQGNTLMWTSIGSKKIAGSKKITISSVSALIQTLYSFCNHRNLLSTYVKIKGTNKLKSNFLKHLKSAGFDILLIQENLLSPFGGCKQSRMRKL